MKNTLLSEVRRFQKIAGLLKEDVNSDPSGNAEVVQKAESFLKSYVDSNRLGRLIVNSDEYVDLIDDLVSRYENEVNDDDPKDFLESLACDLLPQLGVRLIYNPGLEFPYDEEDEYYDTDETFDDLEEDSDYDEGTPSGDTDVMNIG